MHMDGMKLTRRVFSPRYLSALAITITLAIGGSVGLLRVLRDDRGQFPP